MTNLNAVVAKLDQVKSNPAIVTAETTKLNVTMTVTSVTAASVVSVVIPRPTVNVQSGTPYIAMNVTQTSKNFVAAEIQTLEVRW